MSLTVSSDGADDRAIVTSYQCGNTHVDSTGRSTSSSPTLIIQAGVPILFSLDADIEPLNVELRLYAEAGISGYFFKWPEELPGGPEPLDQFGPAPSSSFQYLPEVPLGEYSLVVRGAWEGRIHVFYAVSFRLE